MGLMDYTPLGMIGNMVGNDDDEYDNESDGDYGAEPAPYQTQDGCNRCGYTDIAVGEQCTLCGEGVGVSAA